MAFLFGNRCWFSLAAVCFSSCGLPVSCNPSSVTLYYSPPHFLAHRKFDIFRKISPLFAGADLQQHSSQLFKSHYFGLKR